MSYLLKWKPIRFVLYKVFIFSLLLMVLSSTAKADEKKNNILVGHFDDSFFAEDDEDKDYGIYRFFTLESFKNEANSAEYEEINTYCYSDGKTLSDSYVYVRIKATDFSAHFDYDNDFSIMVRLTEKTITCSFKDEEPADYEILTIYNDEGSDMLPFCKATGMSSEPYTVKGCFVDDSEICDYPFVPEILYDTAVYRFDLEKNGMEYIVMEKKFFKETFSANTKYSFLIFDTGKMFEGKKLYTNFYCPALDYMTFFAFHSYGTDEIISEKKNKDNDISNKMEMIKFIVPVILIVFIGIVTKVIQNHQELKKYENDSKKQ